MIENTKLEQQPSSKSKQHEMLWKRRLKMQQRSIRELYVWKENETYQIRDSIPINKMVKKLKKTELRTINKYSFECDDTNSFP